MIKLAKLSSSTLLGLSLFLLLMQTTATAQSQLPFILVAAGDIADCESEGDTQTADQIQTIMDSRRNSSVGISVTALGDTAYESGTPENFEDCYQPTWGKYLTWTLPVVGNHEYLTPEAAGYAAYFGARAGDPDKLYYSKNLPNDWLFIALNSNCAQVGGCDAGNPQEVWLRDVLAANPHKCVIAAMHQLPFSSGQNGDTPRYAALAKALYEYGADILIGGHDHNYQRYVPMNDLGQADPKGFREFVIGTGGSNFGPDITPTVPITSAALQFDVFGVAEFQLFRHYYTWDYRSVDGSYVDSGAGFCGDGLDWFLPAWRS